LGRALFNRFSPISPAVYDLSSVFFLLINHVRTPHFFWVFFEVHFDNIYGE